MPTTTLRPLSNNGSSGYTLSGGATLEGVLSDNSDTSFARVAAGDTSFMSLILDTLSLPSGSALRSVTPRLRGRTVSGVASPEVGIALESGAELLGTAPLSSSFATVTLPSIASMPSSPVVARIAAIFLAQTVDLAELYLDVFYATQPSTTVLAPTGTVVNTTQPLIRWLHTPGTDGGAQAAWEVWVYNDAQYTATGFSAGQSTPFWSASGAGTTNQVTPLVNLVDDNYRVYVRTAQSINGANHWASFDTENFTVSSDPPPAPTITATPDGTNARVRLVATIDDTEASIVGVQHSVDGGATWLPVRGATRVVVPGDTWIGYDYESPNGGATAYRAAAIRPTVNGDIASAWSSVATTSWSSPYTWLKDIRNPNRSRRVRFSVMPQVTRDRPQGVFTVLGSSYPTVTQGRLQATAGTAKLLVSTEAEFDDLLVLLATDVLLLQSPATHRWGSRYVKPGKVDEDRPFRLAQIDYRVLSFPYIEVAAPPDDGINQLAGLTWQDIIDTYPTWADFIAAVPSWGVLF